MSEDVIRVEIDDSEVDMAIAKLKQAITLSTQTFGSGRLDKASRQFMRDWTGFWGLAGQPMRQIPAWLDEIGAADLPTANREMRLIAGQVPGMREAFTLWFRIRRIQLAIARGTSEADTLRDFFLNPSVVLTILATAVILIRTFLQQRARLERERLAYEEFLRRERGLSKREFDILRAGTKRQKKYFWSLPG